MKTDLNPLKYSVFFLICFNSELGIVRLIQKTSPSLLN